jgi:hypothetical protein
MLPLVLFHSLLKLLECVFFYDGYDYGGRELSIGTGADVDEPVCRRRAWSMHDIDFYLTRNNAWKQTYGMSRRFFKYSSTLKLTSLSLHAIRLTLIQCYPPVRMCPRTIRTRI